MRNILLNILVLFRKEVQIIWADPRNRTVLFAPVLIQALLFGYVATFDLNNVSMAVLDEDRSESSSDLIELFDGSPTFIHAYTLENSSQIAPILDEKKAVLVLHIGPTFEHDLTAGQDADVQILVDGRNGNVAGIASGYASALVDAFNRERMQASAEPVPGLAVTPRAWFNPNLETRWNMVSGMSVTLAMIQVMLLSALTVAREREQGTFDQLLVTPLSSMTILWGKSLPPVVIGLAQSALVILIALFWFRIPFSGSYALLFAGLVMFNFALVGVGLCISTLTSTMQQAMLYSFSLIITMILLSGYVTPVTSMPAVLQTITLANPVRHAIDFAQRIYLEGATWSQLWPDYAALAVIGLVTLGTASRLFRRGLN